MGIFDKIFGKKKEEFEKPNNDKLFNLLNKYKDDTSYDNYSKVVNELMEGNSFLILPSVNDKQPKKEWDTLKKDSTLKLTSVFDLDGLKVLGAFSDEKALLKWSKKETEFTAMKGQDVLEFCQTNRIDRIVINSEQPTMFVLERNQGNVKTETIEKKTEIQVGAPSNPISGKLLEKFKNNFSKVKSVNEVYHYAMVRNNESILILAFRLDIYNDNSRKACINSIQDSMDGEKLNLPLEVFFLEEDNWYQTAKGIPNSLIYHN